MASYLRQVFEQNRDFHDFNPDRRRIAQLLDMGLNVVIRKAECYCPSTDAPMGTETRLEAAFDSHFRAKNHVAGLTQEVEKLQEGGDTDWIEYSVVDLQPQTAEVEN